jgi:predicted nucleic acid-binding protein
MVMIWVLDASVAVRWFVEEEAHGHADEVLEKVIDDPQRFAVPELFAFEVYSVLMRMHPNGLDAFEQGVIPLLQGGMFRQPMAEGLAQKASRFVGLGLTGYDACYAALAKDLGCTWITYDKKAHSLLKNHHVSWCLEDGMPPNWPG